jgi:hypothetical protein
MYRLYYGCDYGIETMYGLCMDYGLCIWYCLWMCFVKSVLLVNPYMWYCGLCVFCCELKDAEKSVLGGIMNFRRPVRRSTKIHAGRQLFSWATGADENKAPIFVGHRGRRKYPADDLFSSALGKPTKIGRFRRTDGNSCLFSSNLFSAAIFVGLRLFSWVFGPRKFRRFL